ncbi:hypothetical protein TSUD_300100 [Trifolium subterraneum]|uniref:Uncharacterized protein n=1 Tax=Trifolium subterraneum TaxID=3900 RepID=A0A2Z6P4J4_TRISU|nr:hypothetical protein TSUD_300100 [Trifolium subterraneum]
MANGDREQVELSRDVRIHDYDAVGGRGGADEELPMEEEEDGGERMRTRIGVNQIELGLLLLRENRKHAVFASNVFFVS